MTLEDYIQILLICKFFFNHRIFCHCLCTFEKWHTANLENYMLETLHNIDMCQVHHIDNLKIIKKGGFNEASTRHALKVKCFC